MMWSDDPVADAERYFAEQEKELDKLPVCTICMQHIQDEYCYEVNDEIICEKCMVEYFRKDVDDYVC